MIHTFVLGYALKGVPIEYRNLIRFSHPFLDTNHANVRISERTKKVAVFKALES